MLHRRGNQKQSAQIDCAGEVQTIDVSPAVLEYEIDLFLIEALEKAEIVHNVASKGALAKDKPGPSPSKTKPGLLF